jgi:hypothetical protein
MNKIKFYWDVVSPTLWILFVGLTIFFTLGMVLSIPVCLLWNWLMPLIFGLPKLNLLESFGLSILVSLLSPRKLGLPNKNDVKKDSELDEYNEKLNKSLEDLLQDLSSQFRA